MNTIHHRGVNSYLDQDYKTKAIPKNLILSKSKHDSYFDVILHRNLSIKGQCMPQLFAKSTYSDEERS